MANPTCQTLAPDGLTWYGAFLRGQCLSDGGSPTQMRFAYYRWPLFSWWQYTPWQDVDEGQTLSVYCTDLNYRSTNDVQCQVRNADGYGWGDKIRFWLPTPTKPKEGPPWLATYQGGRFTETHYIFTMLTDIPCHLHCLVGDRKPWVSLSTHIIRGVTFHHDPELYFKWFATVTQDETGDSIIHTFTLPCPLDNVTYWLVARGTVDDLESPSICPPFSYQRYPVPEMEVLDADAITTTSAMLHGLLVKDQGGPAFVRHRYTKVDIYNHYTPIVGPYYSPKQFDQQIENLDPDTEYKFASMGSHDQSMERYGWSYPKYFRTLEPDYIEKCHCTGRIRIAAAMFPGCNILSTFKPKSSYGLVKFILRIHKWTESQPPTFLEWSLFNVGTWGLPVGEALITKHFDIPSDLPLTWTEFAATFPAIQLVEGQSYGWGIATPEEGEGPYYNRYVIGVHYGDTCKPTSGWTYLAGIHTLDWSIFGHSSPTWYRTFSL